MKKVFFYSRKKFLVFALLVLFVDGFGICSANTFLSKDKNELPAGGSWGGMIMRIGVFIFPFPFTKTQITSLSKTIIL